MNAAEQPAVSAGKERFEALFEIAALVPHENHDRLVLSLQAMLRAQRAEALAEAIEAARGEYLTDGTGTDVDNAYNDGVTDAIAAIGRLLEGGTR